MKKGEGRVCFLKNFSFFLVKAKSQDTFLNKREIKKGEGVNMNLG